MASDLRRGKPYIWPSWISGLVSGEQQCWWRAWYRAHHRSYEKLDGVGAVPPQWRADHAMLVQAHAQRLAREGWTVTVEDQNKQTVDGKAAVFGYCPDIVGEQHGLDNAIIADGKTGRPRDSDHWQVLTYMMLETLAGGRLAGKQVLGQVVYPSGEPRAIEYRELVAARPAIVRAVKLVAALEEPARVPSVRECERCDIAACPDRARAEQAAVITEEF